jgi:glutamine synthetase
MKEWAIEKGAINFTHWFQPMTGITAEKHDAFISRSATERSFWNFRARNWSRANPMRQLPVGWPARNAEARGYTVWDPTSYAFVKDTTLYIPTAFALTAARLSI